MVSLENLEWNTLENMVLKWNAVFRQFGLMERAGDLEIVSGC